MYTLVDMHKNSLHGLVVKSSEKNSDIARLKAGHKNALSLVFK